MVNPESPFVYGRLVESSSYFKKEYSSPISAKQEDIISSRSTLATYIKSYAANAPSKKQCFGWWKPRGSQALTILCELIIFFFFSFSHLFTINRNASMPRKGVFNI